MLNAFCTSGSSPSKKAQPDFHLFSDVPNPTVYLLTPYSKSACAWVSVHIPDDAMWFGSSIVIEHRYAAALLAQIERDGLVVSRG
jgi:hypothetical protein